MAKKIIPPIDKELESFLAHYHPGQRIYIGIDPGIEGAISVMLVNPSGKFHFKVFDIPTNKAEKMVNTQHLKLRRAGALKAKQKKKVKRTTTRSEYKYDELARFFQLLSLTTDDPNNIHITIEKVVVTLFRPGGGACRACKRQFGLSPYSGVAVGIANAMWPMVLYTHGWFKFAYVTAKMWKKYMGLISRDKNAARRAAIAMFKDNAVDFERVKDHNRAESALIAVYGYKNQELLFRANQDTPLFTSSEVDGDGAS